MIHCYFLNDCYLFFFTKIIFASFYTSHEVTVIQSARKISLCFPSFVLPVSPKTENYQKHFPFTQFLFSYHSSISLPSLPALQGNLRGQGKIMLKFVPYPMPPHTIVYVSNSFCMFISSHFPLPYLLVCTNAKALCPCILPDHTDISPSNSRAEHFCFSSAPSTMLGRWWKEDRMRNINFFLPVLYFLHYLSHINYFLLLCHPSYIFLPYSY